MELSVGTVFDTDYETGCTVVEPPPEDKKYKGFLATAPDGVVCVYLTVMVKGHPDYDPR